MKPDYKFTLVHAIDTDNAKVIERTEENPGVHEFIDGLKPSEQKSAKSLA